MSNLTNQDRAYLLLRGNQNRQVHIQVNPQPATVLQVPVIYQTAYFDSGCHCHCNDDSARMRYAVRDITSGISDLGVSIAELIVACKKNSNSGKSSETSATSGNSNQPGAVDGKNAQNQSEIATLRQEIADLKKLLAEGTGENSKEEPTSSQPTSSQPSSSQPSSTPAPAPVDNEKTPAAEPAKETESGGTSASSSIADAKKAAKDANGVFAASGNAEDQRQAIIAYNNWAKAVLNKDNKANLTEINECLSSMEYLCKYNTSSYVSTVVSEAKNLLADLQQLQKTKLAEADNEYLRSIIV